MHNQAEPRRMDKRQRKTRRAIKEAFFELLLEKEINKITISALAERADINRKTFYAHYKDIYEIMNDTENEFINTLINNIASMQQESSYTRILYMLTSCTDYLNEHMLFYKNFLIPGRYGIFADKLSVAITDSLSQKLSKNCDLPYNIVESRIIYATAGIAKLHRNWLVSGRDMPLEEFAEFLSVLVSENLKEILPGSQKPKQA